MRLTAAEIAMEAAIKIASEANECCHLSDGYEEELRQYAYVQILEAITGINRP